MSRIQEPTPLGAGATSAVTRLLVEARGGNLAALDQAVALVYEELLELAREKLRYERVGHTLNATALVHEAYLRLVDQTRVEWQSRSHFMAVASQAMRRILVNHAQARRTQKRGGGAAHLSLGDAGDPQSEPDLLGPWEAEDVLELHQALERLAVFNARGARVVECRFFGGMSYDEIAEVLGLSVITVRRAWSASRAWLRRELRQA